MKIVKHFFKLGMLALCLGGCSIGENDPSGGGNHQTKVNDGTFLYSGSSVSALNTSISGDLVIPETYNGFTITTIEKDAFKNCSNITSIVVPKTVTNIGESAFSGCLRLNSITIPFVGLSPDKSGYGGHFGQIFGKTEYSGGIETSQSYKLSNPAFGSDPNGHNKYYIPASLKKVTVTNATTLVMGAFENCSMLTEINLNDDIVAVGNLAFSGASQIEKVSLPNIYTIPEQCFYKCTKLNEFVIGDNVTKIEEYAFESCINLEMINSDVLGNFVIPENVIEVGEGIFSNCLKCVSVKAPFIGLSDSKTSGGGHFGQIFGMKKKDTGVTRVGSSYLNSIGQTVNNYYYVPNSLGYVTITNASHVVMGAFENCSMLKNLKINKAAQSSVGTNAFKNCVEPTWY